MKYYRVTQGKFIGSKFVQPEHPVTDEGMQRMLKNGIAEEITEQQAEYAKWGSGNYAKIDGVWTCITAYWDTSG